MKKESTETKSPAEYCSRVCNYFVTQNEFDKLSPAQRVNVCVVNDLDAPVNRSVMIALFFSATMSNPNGDLDADGIPRQNPYTYRGMTSDVCIKHHGRSAVSAISGMPMHVMHESGVLLEGTLEAAKAKCKDTIVLDAFNDLCNKDRAKSLTAQSPKKGKGKKKEDAETGAVEVTEESVSSKVKFDKIIASNMEYFFDDRTWGRLFTKPINEGTKGPVQHDLPQSIHPIEIIEVGITTKMVASYDEKNNQDKDRNIGRYSVVNFGLYHSNIYVSANQAARTGFSWRDLNFLLNGFALMWELNKAGRRTGVEHERMYVVISKEGEEGHLNPMSPKRFKNLVMPLDSLSAPEGNVARNSMQDYQMIERSDIESKLDPGIKLLIID